MGIIYGTVPFVWLTMLPGSRAGAWTGQDRRAGVTPMVARGYPVGPDCRMKNSASPRVSQLRLVVEVEDLEAAVAFYRDALGLPVELDLEGDAGEHVVILDAGRATFELSNPAQVAMIDDVEVGRRVAPRVRVAFEVEDATTTTRRLLEAGAELVAGPTRTPWSSLNSRLEAPADLQLTLFQELEPDEH